LWLDFRDYNLTDEQIKDKFCKKARVITQGGANYDEKSLGQFHRLCIASPKGKVMEALERISKEFK
jgi:cystathionine beta-lyase